VIAGAGTGKTTTIMGKIIYLLKTGAMPASKIAVFSYTHDSAAEIRERIKNASHSNIYTGTFHAFAKNIVEKVEQSKRKISSNALGDFLHQRISVGGLSEQEKQLFCKISLFLLFMEIKKTQYIVIMCLTKH
jgi:DNA helicase-4